MNYNAGSEYVRAALWAKNVVSVLDIFVADGRGASAFRARRDYVFKAVFLDRQRIGHCCTLVRRPDCRRASHFPCGNAGQGSASLYSIALLCTALASNESCEVKVHDELERNGARRTGFPTGFGVL